MFGLNRRQLLALLVFAGILYAATQYVPPYFYSVQFNDFVRQEVKYAGSARKTTDQVRAAIVQRASELNIDVGPRDVRIRRRGPTFVLDVEYGFPIDLRVYRHELQFHTTESGEIIENASR